MGLLEQINDLAKHALNACDLGLWVWRPQTGEFDFDLKWCEMTGVDFKSAPRAVETWKNQVHPHDLFEVMNVATNMLAQKASKWENFHRLRQPDGKWRWVLSRILVLERSADQSATQILGTHMDVSAFKEQEDFSEEIQRIANIGGWFLDLKTMKTRWTSGTYRIHDLPLNAQTDKSKGVSFYVAEDQERINKALQLCIKGKPFKDRYRLTDLQGIQKWVEVTGQAQTDANGVISGVRGTIQDISELYRKEQQLLAQTEKFERLMQNTPGMVYQFVLEPNGKMYFLYVSPKAFDIYELQPEDFEKNPSIMLELADPDDRDGLRSAIFESARTMQPFDWRGRINTQTGKVKWIHARSVPSLEPNGSILWDGIVVDVTREEEMAQKLKEEQLRLVHQSKLISLGEMAAGVAHEINNPLAIVTGKVQVLSEIREDGERFQNSVESCTRALHRISRIVKSLQKFSRSGQLTDRAVLPIKQILDEVFVLTQPRAIRAQVELFQQINTDASIRCNLVEIEQVLINLINNGIDAACESGNTPRWVEIHALNRDSKVVIQVSDSGSGVPATVRPRLFEPFFTTKPVGQGTGLGLSIAKGILDEHAATIQLNERMPATCFEITFDSVVPN